MTVTGFWDKSAFNQFSQSLGSARIYQPTIETSSSVSVMLTPPLIVSGVMCVAYNRLENLFYLLVSPRKIWIYTSKTNPACKFGFFLIGSSS